MFCSVSVAQKDKSLSLTASLQENKIKLAAELTQSVLSWWWLQAGMEACRASPLNTWVSLFPSLSSSEEKQIWAKGTRGFSARKHTSNAAADQARTRRFQEPAVHVSGRSEHTLKYLSEHFHPQGRTQN